MSDYAHVKYSPPPTKAELARRIAKGEVLRRHLAVLGQEYGLGYVARLKHDADLVLKPQHLHSSKMLARLRRAKRQ